MNRKHAGKHTHIPLRLKVHTLQNPIQPHTPGLLASGLKTSLESHKVFNDSPLPEAPLLPKRPQFGGPILRGRTPQLGLRRSEPGAALESLDGAGPRFLLKPTKMETQTKSFDAALCAELSLRARLRF